MLSRWPHLHAHTVVAAPLIVAHGGVGFGIEEIAVWVERVQRAGNRPVIDRLVGLHRIGVVLLDRVINQRERFQALAYRIVGGRGLRSPGPQENRSPNRGCKQRHH